MKKIFLLPLVFLLMGFSVPEPPKIADRPTYEYLRTIRNNLNKPQVVTTNPSGVRLGEYGEMIIYKNGTSFYLMVNTSSPNGTSWLGILLGVI